MSFSENILVVPRSLFDSLGSFQGVIADPEEAERYLTTFLDPQHHSFLARDEAEEDPSFKQLIPYIILTAEGKILQYRRGKGSGEQRLLKKRSIGIGGHINDEDGEGSAFGSVGYQKALRRELEEELDLSAALGGKELEATFRPLALINDDSNPVGEVHLGVVHQCHLSVASVAPKEEAIAELSFWSHEELLQKASEFESWSQLLIPALKNF